MTSQNQISQIPAGFSNKDQQNDCIATCSLQPFPLPFLLLYAFKGSMCQNKLKLNPTTELLFERDQSDPVPLLRLVWDSVTFPFRAELCFGCPLGLSSCLRRESLKPRQINCQVLDCAQVAGLPTLGKSVMPPSPCLNHRFVHV